MFACLAVTLVIDRGDVPWYRWLGVGVIAVLLVVESVKLYRLRRA